jgi:hypothetical protein
MFVHQKGQDFLNNFALAEFENRRRGRLSELSPVKVLEVVSEL